jgi:hypothetical protein
MFVYSYCLEAKSQSNEPMEYVIHYYNPWAFKIGFLIKNTQNDNCGKDNLVNLDKLIWTC